jgi:hypothetical protein
MLFGSKRTTFALLKTHSFEIAKIHIINFMLISFAFFFFCIFQKEEGEEEDVEWVKDGNGEWHEVKKDKKKEEDGDGEWIQNAAGEWVKVCNRESIVCYEALAKERERKRATFLLVLSDGIIVICKV